MLDTDICIDIRRKRPERVPDRFRALRPGERVMSPITRRELPFGIEKVRDAPGSDAARRAFDGLARMSPVVALSDAAAGAYASFRARLRRTGLMTGNDDLWIASHARASDLIPITDDTREVDRPTPDLTVESWLEDAASVARRGVTAAAICPVPNFFPTDSATPCAPACRASGSINVPPAETPCPC